MQRRQRFALPQLACVTAFAWCALASTACKSDQAGEPAAPAPPARITTESDLASVVLTPMAEERLGITTAPVAVKSVRRMRAAGGEILLPLGREVVAAQAQLAPAPQDAADGTPAETHGSVYALPPAMTASELARVAEQQVDADGQVAAEQVRVEAARVILDRAQRVVADRAAPHRVLDDAATVLRLAQVALETARARRALLGAPLFDTARQGRLWVRVSIYAGDVDQVDPSEPALVSPLGAHAEAPQLEARLLDLPLSPAVTPATVDLFYEIESPQKTLRPGQEVAVAIPLSGAEQDSVVPASAVLYDIHGGSWVYENTAPHTFTRRRVELRYVADADAVLARGPQPGAKVVTVGASELYGAEFGAGH